MISEENTTQLELQKNTPVSARPSAVYRLQFHHEFTFKDALPLIPYLKELGVDFVYCSPYFQAVKGSMHGYNITDPGRINPEIGTEEDFNAFCEVLQRHGIGQILDIVPNHMGITGNQNKWWLDVLENGPSSLYAHFFDIDWDPAKKEVKDRVLLPILGDYYGSVLENGDIQVTYLGGGFTVKYFEHELPLAPETYPMILEMEIGALRGQFEREEDPNYLELLSLVTALRQLPAGNERNPELKKVRSREKEIAKKRLASLAAESPTIREFIQSRLKLINGTKGDPRSFDRLDNLLNQQAYRLSFWRVASEEINYRRFFDINELAAIRIENLDVFRRYHELAFRLLREGKVHGFRIDHPDGLYDPAEYFRRLQESYASTLLEHGKHDDPVSGSPLFVIVEKILERKELLPEDWKLHGTVGYDFMNLLNGIFVDRENENAVDAVYEKFIGRSMDFGQLLYEKKKFFSLIYMASEINALGNLLDQISERQREYRDFTRNNLTLAIRELIACFPVYRTYISPRTRNVSRRDQKYIGIAVEKAKSKTPFLDSGVYDFLKKILLLQWEPALGRDERELYRDFVLRFQQLSGPVMAKGLEDTSFYIYNRLISLNEVGADPGHFGVTADDFHNKNLARSRRWPYSFLATSTHDSKRSEDVRLRINVLSELTEEWRTRIEKWSVLNARHKSLIRKTLEPNANFEYQIYQTLLGVWPDEGVTPENLPAFQDRIWNYCLKSIREAKVRTSWVAPDAEYEETVKKFVYGALSFEEGNSFISDFISFQEKISKFGFWNSLSAVVLKTGSPGVVDTYQGCELMDYSLVDPDNRRPVDYSKRAAFLNSLKVEGKAPSELVQELLRMRKDGRLKLYLLWKGLNHRQKQGELFTLGEYIPLKAEGIRKRNVIAFAREKNGKTSISAAARFFTELLPDENSVPAGLDVWQDTVLELPEQWAGKTFENIFTGEILTPVKSGDVCVLKLSDVFKTLGACILHAES